MGSLPAQHDASIDYDFKQVSFYQPLSVIPAKAGISTRNTVGFINYFFSFLSNRTTEYKIHFLF